MKFFSVGEQATKQARKLKKEKGISVTPSNYNREGLDKETQNVLNSLREMMSVVCVQLKKIVLTSETKMVQKRRFRRCTEKTVIHNILKEQWLLNYMIHDL